MAKILLRISVIHLLLSGPALFPLPASAGSFTVVPTIVSLDARARTAVFRVTNTGDAPVTVQMEIVTWSQEGDAGDDRYAPTNDLVLFPKIVTIDRGSERTVRIGYQAAPAGPREKAYRLYLRELPVSQPGETAVKMALRLGIPIFIKPGTDVRQRAIENVTLRQGELQVRVANGGTRHVLVKSVGATGLDASGEQVFSKDAGGWYVLAGTRRTFFVDLPEDECKRARLLRVVLATDQTAMDARAPVDTAECAPPLPTTQATDAPQR